jgi:hypothetical protein
MPSCPQDADLLGRPFREREVAEDPAGVRDSRAVAPGFHARQPVQQERPEGRDAAPVAGGM